MKKLAAKKPKQTTGHAVATCIINGVYFEASGNTEEVLGKFRDFVSQAFGAGPVTKAIEGKVRGK